MSKWRLVLLGGYRPVETLSSGAQRPAVHFDKWAGPLLFIGAISFLASPLFLMPSRFGTVPITYPAAFVTLSGPRQYIYLLERSGVIVLSKIFDTPLIDETSFPKPPDSTTGLLIVLIIGVLLIGAISGLSIGTKRLINNLGK